VCCGHSCHAVAPAGWRCILQEGKSTLAEAAENVKSNGKAKGKVQKANGKSKQWSVIIL
jgi:hypothetical protein